MGGIRFADICYAEQVVSGTIEVTTSPLIAKSQEGQNNSQGGKYPSPRMKP